MRIPPLYGQQKRVLIAGAGFAGLTLAKRLSSKYFQVVLIDRNNYHQFQPLLYQVATCGLEPSSISFPIRKIFRDKENVFIRITEVKGVSTEFKILHTESGNIPYDYLILAQGVTTNYFKNNPLQKNAYAMKSLSEALLLRNTLLENYEKALTAEHTETESDFLNIVIVGGGPTGVELAGAIAEMKNEILPREYTELNFSDMHIYLLEVAPGLLNGMSEVSGTTVVRYLTQLGVEVRANTFVKDYDGETVLLSSGKTIRSRCLIWAAGVIGVPIPGIPAALVSAGGRITVDRYNQVIGLQDVYAIGDIALMQSGSLPKGHPQVAQVAMQQAKQLAINLKKMASGRKPAMFEYKDRGSLATVGRNLALAEIGKLKLKGFIAWVVWMTVHLVSIIGIKNRLFVLINWVWQYITYDQSLRLIIKPTVKKMKRNPMKKITVLLMVISFMLACHSETDKAVIEKADSVGMRHEKQEEKSAVLVLNNGNRWKADSITKWNVSLLQTILSHASKNSPANYSQTAIQLQDGLIKMVSECKMKGEDHEALHHWLLPLMQKTKDLKSAVSAEKAAPVLKEIEAHIMLFDQYFE